jgi:hypothetical protein
MALTDVAPTICATAGVDLPGPEGRVHTDLLPPDAAAPTATAPTVDQGRPLRALHPDPPARSHRQGPSVLDATLDLGVETARRVDSLEQRLAEQQHALAVAQERLHVTTADLDAATAQLHATTAGLDAALNRLEDLKRQQDIWATTAWLAHEPVVEGPLISVITPTHRRPEKLRRAIDSVLAQRYGRWELVIVDDGDDAGKGVVAAVGDERIVYQQIPHSGACAARNVALELARGSLITYLDDDNALDPGWLHAVAWAFENHPDDDVLYGARIFDDEQRTHGFDAGGFPWVQLVPFDRAALEQNNMADMGVIAHRRGIPGARFDEDLWECGDWDFFLAITEDRDPLMLPVVAFYYRTDGTDRLTGRFVHHADLVREKWARRRAGRGERGVSSEPASSS